MIIKIEDWVKKQRISILLLTLGSITFAQNLPNQTSTLFSGSGNCTMCHAAAFGEFITSAGEDVSPVTTWRSSMMANAARDPLWQAKVTAEVAENPHLKSVIEDKCTTCHTPMARTDAKFNGQDQYSFAEIHADPLAQDGVSCTLCHQIQPDNLGQEESFTGGFHVTDEYSIFGPYQNPVTMPMANQTGFTPVYSEHVNDSELCATCHTLFTPFVDDDGNVAGTFPEQVPYLEWQNSVYPDEGKECQTCHMPAIDEALKIAGRPPWLSTLRKPVWKHDFVGANIYMLNMLKENAQEVGATANDVHFDSTLAKSERSLKGTVQLTAKANVVEDTLIVNVSVKNLAGHKFPTGFPSRRAWLRLTVKNSANETVFQSGQWNDSGEIVGLDDNFEPHHNVITSKNQVQVYQAIMGDVNDDVTYTLLRGAKYLKDNRLPPAGFKSSVETYESIKIAGIAQDDPNFNKMDGTEGTGSDEITYKIHINANEDFIVLVDMFYQTIAPNFAKDLLDHDTEQIATFKGMFETNKNEPIPVASTSVATTATSIGQRNDITPNKYYLLSNYPNPFNSSTAFQYHIEKTGHVSLEIINTVGKTVKTLTDHYTGAGTFTISWNGIDNAGQDLPSGIYFAQLKTSHKTISHQILLLK
jgi:hypothetical protein